ncbi:MAG: FtsQ-type POTRA domain-containing protein [Acidobacteriota bacterium]
MATRRSEPRVINQVVARRKPRRASARPQPRSRADLSELLRSARFFAKPAAILVVGALLVIGYNALAGSRLFEVRKVEVSGASESLATDIEHTVRRAVGQTRLLYLDLATIKQRVEAITRVRSATVARALPDAIHISVTERQPTILARRESQAIMWLDDEGVELGEITSFDAGEEVPPIAKGLSEGARTRAAEADDRDRIAIYKQLHTELGEAWKLIDEIDLTFPKNINVRLISPPVTVVLGGREFRERFDMAHQVLSAIRLKDTDTLGRFRVQDPERLVENADNISFIDVSRSDRIVLSFSTPGREKLYDGPMKASSQKPKPSVKKTVRQEPKNRGQVKKR